MVPAAALDDGVVLVVATQNSDFLGEDLRLSRGTRSHDLRFGVVPLPSMGAVRPHRYNGLHPVISRPIGRKASPSVEFYSVAPASGVHEA
jgi:hypothetical protein